MDKTVRMFLLKLDIFFFFFQILMSLQRFCYNTKNANSFKQRGNKTNFRIQTQFKNIIQSVLKFLISFFWTYCICILICNKYVNNIKSVCIIICVFLTTNIIIYSLIIS